MKNTHIVSSIQKEIQTQPKAAQFNTQALQTANV